VISTQHLFFKANYLASDFLQPLRFN